MNRYLITGGAGFIGSHFCQWFLERHPENYYVCVDALTYAGNLEFLTPVLTKSNFKFFQANICDEEFIDSLFEEYKFDYVINFAAETHVDRSITNTKDFIQTNIIGTFTLLEKCRKYGIKRFHQVSTDEVYGSLTLNTKQEWDEEAPLNPSNPYSASKASADLLCLSYYKTYGIDITISRCCNNFGEHQNKEKFIPCMIQHALHNEALPIYGNGLNERDWIYVLDHCSAIEIILQKGEAGNVYNVSAHNIKSNVTIANYILNEFKQSESMIEYIKDRPGHDLRYAVNSKKLENLGWKARYSFEEQLKKTIQVYKKKYQHR